MTTIEDRLRAATQAAADTVTDYSQPPLRLPAPARGIGWPHPRIGAPRLMASVAAATAIVAVIATVVVTRDVAAGNRAAAARAAEAVRAAAPPFFVAAFTTKTSLEYTEGALAVGRTASGRILATVRPPAPYTTFGAIGAAADDRTFVVAAQKSRIVHQHGNLVFETGPARLYLLHLHPGRTPVVTFTALPIPVFGRKVRVTGISMSPSGARLAVSLQGAISNSPSDLRVYDLTNGKFTTWSLPAPQPERVLSPGRLSWVGGNRFLAIFLDTGLPKSCKGGCVQLLDTTRPGGRIMSTSKTIFATAKTHRYTFWTSFLITPEGSRMILAGTGGRHLRNGNSEFDTPLLYTIAVPSGQIMGFTSVRHGPDFFPLWAGVKGEPTILGHHLYDGYLAATIYGEQHRNRPVPLRLPAKTLGVVW